MCLRAAPGAEDRDGRARVAYGETDGLRQRGGAGVLARVAQALAVWSERIRQRRQIAALSDEALKDIGLTRLDAWREWRKPWWQP